MYLRQPALPELAVAQEGDEVILTWKTPVEGAFPLAVPVRFGRSPDNPIERIEMVDGRIALPMTEPFTIDPHGWLLKQ